MAKSMNPWSISVAIIAAVCVVAVMALADALNIQNTFLAGTPATEAKFANAFNSIETWANSGLIATDNLKDGGIESADLKNGIITTVKLADDAVTAAKIAEGAVEASEIKDGDIGRIEFSTAVRDGLPRVLAAGRIKINRIAAATPNDSEGRWGFSPVIPWPAGSSTHKMVYAQITDRVVSSGSGTEGEPVVSVKYLGDSGFILIVGFKGGDVSKVFDVLVANPTPSAVPTVTLSQAADQHLVIDYIVIGFNGQYESTLWDGSTAE